MGGLYRLLSDLESSGFIEADWITGQPGPAKKRYRVTGKGIAELNIQSNAFEDTKKRIALFQKRVSVLKDK
jgi:DNA-binding PadR family transcriptional regulator